MLIENRLPLCHIRPVRHCRNGGAGTFWHQRNVGPRVEDRTSATLEECPTMRELSTRKDFEHRQFLAPLSCRLASGEKGVVEGYGSVFNNRDSYGDIVQKGAFAHSLKAHKAAGTMPAMLWQHDPGEPIGTWVSMTEDDTGLKVMGRLALETTRGKEAHALLKMGALTGLSIGFVTAENGSKFDRQTDTRQITEVDLWEVSLVTFPANGKARVTATKSLETRADLETILRDAGLPRGAVKKLVAGGWPALSQPEIDANGLLAEIRNATRTLKGFFK